MLLNNLNPKVEFYIILDVMCCITTENKEVLSLFSCYLDAYSLVLKVQ